MNLEKMLREVKNPLLSFFIGLAIGAVVLAISGINPIKAYYILFEGAFGSLYRFSEVVVQATPLCLCGLAVAIPLKIRLWNIGGEGQFYLGAILATFTALNLPHLPPLISILLVSLAGFTGGALWMLIPALLRARFERANEVLTTFLLDYIGLYLYSLLIYGPLKDPKGYGFPVSPFIPKVSQLPSFGSTRLHPGIIIALVLAIGIYLVINKTRLGIRIRAVGSNLTLARISGVRTFPMIVFLMVTAGGIAGLAGAIQIMGIHHRMIEHISVNYGFTGIAVALLSQGNSLGTVFFSFLLGILYVGGDAMKIHLQAPFETVLLVIWLMVLSIIVFQRKGGRK